MLLACGDKGFNCGPERGVVRLDLWPLPTSILAQQSGLLIQFAFEPLWIITASDTEVTLPFETEPYGITDVNLLGRN